MMRKSVKMSKSDDDETGNYNSHPLYHKIACKEYYTDNSFTLDIPLA
jgi:hypothetical protein